MVSDGLFDEEKKAPASLCNAFFSVKERDLGEGEWSFGCAYFPSLHRKSCYFGHLKYGKGGSDKSTPGVSQRTVRSGLLVTLLSVSICRQCVTFFSYSTGPQFG